MQEAPPGHVAVARVSTAWGALGALKVVPLVGRREQLAPGRSVTLDGRRHRIETARWRKGLVLLKLSGIDDRASALTLRDALLTVPEEDLEPLAEGEYYRFQLVGLSVVTTAGRPLGRVAEVLDTGANDVYVVRDDGPDVLLPATDEVVREINLESGCMVVEAVPGLVPEAKGEA